MGNLETHKFRALSRMVDAAARRDLNLLNLIDKTVDALCESKAEMDYHADTISREVARVKLLPHVIDADGSVVEMLEKARDAMGNIHGALRKKCDSARHSLQLRPDDGVVEAYCAIIDSAAALHNAINDLCWAIGEHDADFDTVVPGGPYTNANDLIAALEA